MGKEEIDNFFCLIGVIWTFFFTVMFRVVLYVSYHFCPNGEFDWLSGWQKWSIFVKMFKNLLLRNLMVDEAESWHTCLGH